METISAVVPAPFTVTLPVSITVTEKRFADLLSCGFEGGVGYWCQIVGYVKPANPRSTMESMGGQIFKHIDYPLTGGAVKCRVTEDAEGDEDAAPMILDGDAIRKGIKVMAEKYPRHFRNFMDENEDAETGDVFIQCCLLGEIVYG